MLGEGTWACCLRASGRSRSRSSGVRGAADTVPDCAGKLLCVSVTDQAQASRTPAGGPGTTSSLTRWDDLERRVEREPREYHPHDHLERRRRDDDDRVRPSLLGPALHARNRAQYGYMHGSRRACVRTTARPTRSSSAPPRTLLRLRSTSPRPPRPRSSRSRRRTVPPANDAAVTVSNSTTYEGNLSRTCPSAAAASPRRSRRSRRVPSSASCRCLGRESGALQDPRDELRRRSRGLHRPSRYHDGTGARARQPADHLPGVPPERHERERHRRAAHA